jgi:hypothetical protein
VVQRLNDFRVPVNTTVKFTFARAIRTDGDENEEYISPLEREKKEQEEEERRYKEAEKEHEEYLKRQESYFDNPPPDVEGEGEDPDFEVRDTSFYDGPTVSAS